MKNIFLLFSLTVCISTYGQVTHKSGQDEVSIYEYGEPLSTCESNFENLFRNWDTWITNHEEIKPISYHYVETLKDNSRIAYYTDLLYSWTATEISLSGNNSIYLNGEMETYTNEFHVRPGTFKEVLDSLEQSKNSLSLDLFKVEIDSIIEFRKRYFRENICIGDKVYLVQLKKKRRIYDYYVICRPKENRIVANELLQIRKMRKEIEK